MKRIILASQSARRIEMLNRGGYDPEIIPADIDENVSADLSPEVAVMYLALSKAMHVADKAVTEEDNSGAIIIAADTVVVHNGKIIGKPENEEDAFNTLSALRNDSHQVITGVCIIDAHDGVRNAIKNCFYDVTDVHFGGYSDKALRAYVQTDEPYDKAGGYAIQMTFGKYVDRIEGDYDNVVGLPWYRVEPLIKAALSY